VSARGSCAARGERLRLARAARGSLTRAALAGYEAIERAPLRVGCFLGPRLGATTHISVLDGEAARAASPATNGEGSGVVVPGTASMSTT
jgi:gamma-glutamyltranspeptidase